MRRVPAGVFEFSGKNTAVKGIEPQQPWSRYQRKARGTTKHHLNVGRTREFVDKRVQH